MEGEEEAGTQAMKDKDGEGQRPKEGSEGSGVGDGELLYKEPNTSTLPKGRMELRVRVREEGREGPRCGTKLGSQGTKVLSARVLEC